MEDTDQIARFLEALFGSTSGFLATGLISGVDPDHPREIDRTLFYQWPDEKDKILHLARKNSEADVYISPMLYSDRHRKAEYVISTPVIWCDADTASPELYELQPSLTIETSPGKWHLYWLIDGEVEPTWAAKMAKLVGYRHRDEGAGFEGWQLSKYLRLPGAMNTKPELAEPFRVTITAHGSGEMYSPDKLVAAFGDPKATGRIIGMPVEEPFPVVIPNKADVLAKIPMSDTISRLLTDPPNRPSWNEMLWGLECRLFRLGLSAPEVFALVHECACDKYTRDNRPDTDLWVEILKAQEQAPTWVDPGTIGLITNANEKDYTPAPIKRPSFLYPEEYTVVESDETFIDKYVAWGKSRTNADPRYHEYGAMCLISTVLADFGHAVPLFGNMKLNMWFMLLGVTTRTYKTTSRKLMLEILNPLNSEDEGYQYKIGSDATPEALVSKLSTMPRRSVMFYGDEVSKFFADIRGGKGYMSGMGETLTELYDGHVRGRLRSTGTKETPEVETAFNLYLMGVPGKVSEILTHEDFATGFLARFLFVIGEPVPRTKESMWLAQQTEEHSRRDDPEAKKLRAELAQTRAWWARQTEPGNTKPIVVEEKAWERYNAFIEDLLEMAAKEPAGEILEPSADRMNKQVLKLACLLAMLERHDKVEMRHMLRAIWYSEAWYTSMVQMSDLIATSAWSARVDKLVSYIAQKGKCKYTQAYRQFREMKPKEFQDLVLSATDAGMMRSYMDADGRWLSA